MGTLAPRQVTLANGAVATLRHATLDDADALLAFLPAVLGETEFLLGEPEEIKLTPDEERAWVQRHLDDPGSLALVAFVGGRLVSSAGLQRPRSRRCAHTAVLGISILQRCCGQGLGTAIMRTLVEWSESNPVLEKLMLRVFSHNARAIRLYQRMGFTEEGRSLRAIKLGPDRYVDDIHMSRFVKPL